MFCPMCGTESQSPNGYCKGCGEWLPDIKRRTRARFGGETPQQHIFTGLFMSTISTLAALFSATALYATYLGAGDAKWWVYVAAAFCVCIAGWQMSSFVVSLKLQRRLKKAHEESSLASELDAQRSSPALSPGDMTNFVSSPSVTENTTRTLEPARSHERNTQP